MSTSSLGRRKKKAKAPNLYGTRFGSMLFILHEESWRRIKELKLNEIALKYTGGDRGWSGDVPKMMLSAEKLNKLGWKARYSSEEAIKKASQKLITEIWK